MQCNKSQLLSRAGHAVITTTTGSSDTIVLFGGYQGDGGFDALTDAHAFKVQDDMEWVEQVGMAGTLPYTNRALCFAQHESKVYSFGGYDGHAANNELVLYDHGRWQPVELWMQMDIASMAASAANNAASKPVARYGHSMVVMNSQLLIFGGSGSLYLNDLVQIDLP